MTQDKENKDLFTSPKPVIPHGESPSPYQHMIGWSHPPADPNPNSATWTWRGSAISPCPTGVLAGNCLHTQVGCPPVGLPPLSPTRNPALYLLWGKKIFDTVYFLDASLFSVPTTLTRMFNTTLGSRVKPLQSLR